MAQSETSLLDLCSICYTETPKYRCPRCETRTCSLPCYKRHQQRASCNGKRNPAAYLKKSQLATPASIDQDYNYLIGVEREIDHASRDALERGIGDMSLTSKSFHRGIHPESVLQRYLTANRICVNRAPIGMYRQKTNHTRSTKRGNIMWTVEWIDNEGVRELQESSLESSTIRELYNLRQVEKSNATKRKLAAQPSQPHPSDSAPKRRRHNDTPATPIPSKYTNQSPVQDEPSNQVSEASTSAEHPTSSPSNESNPSSTTHDPSASAADHHASTKTSTPDFHPPPESPPANPQTQPKTTLIPEQDSHEEQLFFYLLKPNTASAATVLIPLSPTATLTASLRDQAVQEYPTIYALAQGPEALAPAFKTESQYLAAGAKLDAAVQQAQGVGGGAGGTTTSAAASSSAAKDEDAKWILGLLKREIGS